MEIEVADGSIKVDGEDLGVVLKGILDRLAKLEGVSRKPDPIQRPKS